VNLTDICRTQTEWVFSSDF